MYKLMIVDDSNIIRNRIKRGYNASQFELVGTAANGIEALDLFKKLRPEVITMDLTMPGMDGLECISRIIDIDPDVHILVVSALSDKATGIKALELGAQGFICKPFTDEQLIEALNEVVMDDY
ncbi:MAG: response regulator [Neisseriaceae bacterium]|nr:response regulator [Neisseriaceae bacterium]